MTFYTRKLKLGEIYTIAFTNGSMIMQAQFVQTTNRGFNFLNMKTHRMFFKNHFYSCDHKGEPELPRKQKHKVYIPTHIKYII